MNTKLAKSTGKRNSNSIKVEQLRALRRHGVTISYAQAVAIRQSAQLDRWFIRNKITPEYFMRVVETTSTRIVSFATGCGRYEISRNA